MAITIQNLRIWPYGQKDKIKAIWGNTLTLTFEVPHVPGESYILGLDNERVVYPPSRPLCAMANTFVRDGGNITMSLPLNTNRFRGFVSSLKKPMPVWLELVRVTIDIDRRYETILLDDILAIPSVLDAANTVCEGDPLAQLLEGKMDVPATAGEDGQVLTLDADGHYSWHNLPEQEQSDWDASDSGDVSYIRNKPDLGVYVVKEAGKGLSSNDYTNADKAKLNGIEAGAEVNVQADWDASDSMEDSYIRHKPSIPAPQEQSDWDASDSGDVSYIRHKPNLIDVARTVSPTVTVIPPDTAAYTLHDQSYQGCYIYTHAPTTAPVYTLPDVADTSIAHAIIITVDFAMVQTFAFVDVVGDIIVPLNDLVIQVGDVVQFLCWYDSLQGAWVVTAGHINLGG